MDAVTTTPPPDVRPDVRVQLANVVLGSTGTRGDITRATREALAALADVRPGGAR